MVGQMKAESEKLPETASLFSGSMTLRKLPSWVNCFLTAVNGAVDLYFNVTGARFMRISVNEPDELRIRLACAIAIHLKRDFVSGTN
jgi:hypothetical protein